MKLDPTQVDAYLKRLGWPDRTPDRPSANLSTLRALHLAHLRRVPFENFDIHLGRRIVLDTNRIVDKLTHQGRGGFCYELNGGFAALLTALGFDVALLEARVYDGDGKLGIRFDHLCLRVDLDQPYLVDVGFGACFDEPLKLVADTDQHDPAGLYRIRRLSSSDYSLSQDGQQQYRFTLTPRRLGDFTDGCDHHQTSLASHFTQNTVCSLRTASGRVTVRGLGLIETTGDQRTEMPLDPTELGTVLRDRFGITLPGTELARLL